MAAVPEEPESGERAPHRSLAEKRKQRWKKKCTYLPNGRGWGKSYAFWGEESPDLRRVITVCAPHDRIKRLFPPAPFVMNISSTSTATSLQKQMSYITGSVAPFRIFSLNTPVWTLLGLVHVFIVWYDAKKQNAKVNAWQWRICSNIFRTLFWVLNNLWMSPTVSSRLLYCIPAMVMMAAQTLLKQHPLSLKCASYMTQNVTLDQSNGSNANVFVHVVWWYSRCAVICLKMAT